MALPLAEAETRPENASPLAVNASRRQPDEKIEQGYVLTPCTYCGLSADSRDHLRPRVVAAMIAGGLPSPTPFLPNRTVPACGECNSALGARIYPSIPARQRAVRAYLRRKYRRVLEMPTWTESELAELDGSLRSYVEARARLRTLTLERLAWSGPSPVRLAVARSGNARGAGRRSGQAGRGRATARRAAELPITVAAERRAGAIQTLRHGIQWIETHRCSRGPSCRWYAVAEIWRADLARVLRRP